MTSQAYLGAGTKPALLDLGAIRDNNPIADIIGATLPLKRAGRELIACCPFHSEKTPSFTVVPERAFYHCFGCGAHGDVIGWIQQLHNVGFLEAIRLLGAGELPRVHLPTPAPANDRPERRDEAIAIAAKALPVSGTVGEAYLRWRGLSPPYPADVRFSHLPCDNLGRLPCLVAVVRGVGGDVIGVQRIWLAADGLGKADVAKPKRSLGQVKGGAIRLGDLDGSGVVTVCEGPESGLSLREMLPGPVWVGAGAVFLPHMQFPPEIRSVVIAADNDPPGEEAAGKAAQSFAERGLTVRIIRPEAGFADFNDEHRGAC